MNKSFLDKHNPVFRDNIKTLKELSTPKINEQEKYGKQSVLTGYINSEEKEGIDFDTIRCKWCPGQEGINVPCSVDALVLTKNGIFFIEFKSGESIERANLYRKIYDSVILLHEYDNQDNQDFKTMRQSFTYIVVATKLQRNDKTAIARSLFFKKKPWLEPSYTRLFDNWDLKNLEGVVVSKAYCMSPKFFDIFVQRQKWT